MNNETLEYELLHRHLTHDVVAEHMMARGFDPDEFGLGEVLCSVRKLVRKAFESAKDGYHKGGWIVADGPVEAPYIAYVIDAGSRTDLDQDMGFVYELHKEFRMELLCNGIHSAKLDPDWSIEVYGMESPVIAFQCGVAAEELPKLAEYLNKCEVIDRDNGPNSLVSESGWRIFDWMWRVEDYE